MVDVITNIRIIEDGSAFIMLTIAMVYLISAAIKARNMSISYLPTSLVIGILPLYLWKGIGAFNRSFIDKATSPDLSALLNTLGETFEALSGLILALAILYILLKLKGVIGAESVQSTKKKR